MFKGSADEAQPFKLLYKNILLFYKQRRLLYTYVYMYTQVYIYKVYIYTHIYIYIYICICLSLRPLGVLELQIIPEPLFFKRLALRE